MECARLQMLCKEMLFTLHSFQEFLSLHIGQNMAKVALALSGAFFTCVVVI